MASLWRTQWCVALLRRRATDADPALLHRLLQPIRSHVAPPPCLVRLLTLSGTSEQDKNNPRAAF